VTAAFVAGFIFGGTAALIFVYHELSKKVTDDLEERYGEQVAEEIWENKNQDLKVVNQE